MQYATIRKTVSRLIVASFVGIGILYGGSKREIDLWGQPLE